MAQSTNGGNVADSQSIGTKGGRRSFLKAATLSGGAVALGSVAAPGLISKAQAQELQPRQVPVPGMSAVPGKANHWYLPASDKTSTGDISARP